MNKLGTIFQSLAFAPSRTFFGTVVVYIIAGVLSTLESVRRWGRR